VIREGRKERESGYETARDKRETRVAEEGEYPLHGTATLGLSNQEKGYIISGFICGR
jgi:hypothetical protein